MNHIDHGLGVVDVGLAHHGRCRVKRIDIVAVAEVIGHGVKPPSPDSQRGGGAKAPADSIAPVVAAPAAVVPRVVALVPKCVVAAVGAAIIGGGITKPAVSPHVGAVATVTTTTPIAIAPIAATGAEIIDRVVLLVEVILGLVINNSVDVATVVDAWFPVDIGPVSITDIEAGTISRATEVWPVSIADIEAGTIA